MNQGFKPPDSAGSGHDRRDRFVQVFRRTVGIAALSAVLLWIWEERGFQPMLGFTVAALACALILIIAGKGTKLIERHRALSQAKARAIEAPYASLQADFDRECAESHDAVRNDSAKDLCAGFDERRARDDWSGIAEEMAGHLESFPENLWLRTGHARVLVHLDRPAEGFHAYERALAIPGISDGTRSVLSSEALGLLRRTSSVELVRERARAMLAAIGDALAR